PMRQFQERRVGMRGAQLFYDAERDAAAPVDRHPGRLIDHHEGLAFVNDGKNGGGYAASRIRRGKSDGRDPDAVALFKAIVRRDTPFVHAYFSVANRLVDVTLGYAFTQPKQEVVHALSGLLDADLDYTHTGRRWT